MNWMIVMAIPLTVAASIVNLCLARAMVKKGHSTLIDANVAYGILCGSWRAAVVALAWYITGAGAVTAVFMFGLVLFLPWTLRKNLKVQQWLDKSALVMKGLRSS